MRSLFLWIGLGCLLLSEGFAALSEQEQAAAYHATRVVEHTNHESSWTNRELDLIQHVNRSIEQANLEISHVGAGPLSIHGMSSPRVRHLLNNLCNRAGTVYLEIGCFKGSTLVSALTGNEAQLIDAVAIEDFSEFGEHRSDLFKAIRSFIPSAPLRFIEADCFAMNKQGMFPHPVNVYFYDGNHSALCQERAFTEFNSVFDDVFIAVVDDWNCQSVQDGTRSAFSKLGYKVLYEKELFTKNNDPASWWNGLYVSVIRK